MNIIGISGLQNSLAFKRALWPTRQERDHLIYQGSDSAAALVSGGKTVAAAEQERFTRRKHTGEFPVEAIQFCLRHAGLQVRDIQEIAHGFDYEPYRDVYRLDAASNDLYSQVLSREALIGHVRREFPDFPADRIHQVGHHLAHAASAYFTSGWNECIAAVSDGMGEAQSLSIFSACDGKFTKVLEIPAGDSIGILYSLVTMHLGFNFGRDEYKVMGLAPYGDPARFKLFFENAVELRPNGTFRIPILHLNSGREGREFYDQTREYLDRYLIPRRHPGAELTSDHKDVAAALQKCLEHVLLHVYAVAQRKTNLRRLALSGGVSLNCTANGTISRAGIFEEVYIQPVSGDSGTALGAALFRASIANEAKNQRFPVPLFGPSYSMDDIERAFLPFNGRFEVHRLRDADIACSEAARLIAEGNIIAWFRGRMEYGPRALGNRSILANPAHAGMRDRINKLVKKRENFRPFAPAVSVDEAHKWFDVPQNQRLPYMAVTVAVRPEHRKDLSAITHVDGSARVQTVAPDDNPHFYALLQAVGRATGRQMVLNTSFNVAGEPIVNTPRDAINSFITSQVDALFLENVLVKDLRPGDVGGSSEGQ
jgi:carbamoyltransferase